LEGYLWLSNARYGWEWIFEPGVLIIFALVVLTLVMPIIRRIRRGEPAGGEPIVELTRWHLRGDIVFLALVMGVLGAAAVVSTEWVTRASLIIYCLAGVGIVLGLLQISFHLRVLGGPVSDIPAFDGVKAAVTMRRSLENFAWLIGLAASVFLIGFHIAMVIFAVLYIRTYGGSWRISLCLGVVAEFFVVVIFDFLLEIFWSAPALFELMGIPYFS
jgi:hypothetical protein